MEISQVISPHFMCQVTHRGVKPSENNFYKLKSTFRPSRKDIIQAQTQLGFNPDGYLGPSDIEIREVSSGKFLTTWSSAASCE